MGKQRIESYRNFDDRYSFYFDNNKPKRKLHSHYYFTQTQPIFSNAKSLIVDL